MRKILQHIAGMDLSVPSQGLGGWTDFRMVERGFGYVKKVKELAAADDLLAGVVDGTTRYFTNVRIAENGELEAFCSCPVGKRCKHAVALILKAWRMVKSQEEIPSTIAEEWVKAVERKQEEKQYYQRLAVEQREAQRAYEEKCEQECEDAFWRDFNAVREAVFASCREDSVEKIKAAVVTFLEWTDDEELYRHPRLCREVGDALSPTMAAVFETFEANDVDAADMIVWSYELTDPERGFNIGERFEALQNSPSGKYAQPQVWERVACCLKEKLDGIADDDYSIDDSCSRPWYLVEALRTAWERAGKTERAIECYLKHVSRLGNWHEVVRYLIQHQMYDKAIEIAREGVKASQMSGEYGNDYDVELQDPLADAFSGKGDHLQATAIRAEAFLDRIGAYDEKRTVAQFNRILEEAEKAGIREQVRKALIHTLETGLNPSSIVTYEFHPAVQEFDWKPVPKPVVYQIKTTCLETPLWPLLWANEGVRLFDSRWQDHRGFCQQDMEFLLKLALADGDKAEIARRFDDLPETPNAGGFPLEGAKAEMCESVLAAMKGYRGDIVARLAQMRKYCYVTKDEGGLKSAVRVIKRLGESAHSTYWEAL